MVQKLSYVTYLVLWNCLHIINIVSFPYMYMHANLVILGMTNHILGGGGQIEGLTQYLYGQIEDSSVNGYYLKTLNLIT